MKKVIAILLTCAILFSTTEAKADFEPGMYVKGIGGVNFFDMDNIGVNRFDFQTGYIAGGAVGYLFDFGTQVEGEFTYRRNKLDKINGIDVTGQLNVSSISYMVNVIQKLGDPSWEVTPHLGFGFGYVDSTVKLSGAHKFGDDGFGWQGIAGVSTEVGDRTELGVEYRYFDAYEQAIEHSLNLTLTHYF